MAGDGDDLYGQSSLLTLVRADGIQPYWYGHIYTGLVALLDRIQSIFSSKPGDPSVITSDGMVIAMK